MDAILDALKALLSFIEMLVSGVVQLVSLIPQFTSSVQATVAYMPPFIGPLIIFSLAITLLFAIIRLI